MTPCSPTISITLEMKGKGGKRTTSVQPSDSSMAQVSSISPRRAVKPLARLSASASVVGFIYLII